jgi:hypothetical protein
MVLFSAMQIAGPGRPIVPTYFEGGRETDYIDQLWQARTGAVRDVRRAPIVWRFQAGDTVSQIARPLKMTRLKIGGNHAAMRDTL